MIVDNKKIGFGLIVLGLMFAVILIIFKIQIDNLTNSLMIFSGGSCFLENGECVHEQKILPLILGTILVIISLGFGLYLILFSKTTKSFENTQKDILDTIKSAKHVELKEDRFKILLEGLDENEKKIIMAVKEQDGISQSTLKIRTDLSKSKLSMTLSQLESKSLISKVKKGKINNIFLKKAL